MNSPALPFRPQLACAAHYLLARRNHTDGGWGLNIETGHQASSIVNTAEALYVIAAAGLDVLDVEQTLTFLVSSSDKHPQQRGDRLRYQTFAALGLLAANVPRDDSRLQTIASRIESRYIRDAGWGEEPEDPPRLWQTLQCLCILRRLYGQKYLEGKYSLLLNHLLKEAKKADYKPSFSQNGPGSLAATAYALSTAVLVASDGPYIDTLRASCVEQLERAIRTGNLLEVESIHGTDWHHYSFAWAVRAIAQSCQVFDRQGLAVVMSALEVIASLFVEGRGFREPGKTICNVRSIFNSSMAIAAVLDHFDPVEYWLLAEWRRRQTEGVVENSVFLSYSYADADKELVGGFGELLEQHGYKVVTGEGGGLGSLSRSILRKIRASEKFLVVMTTRDRKASGEYTTSSWLLEEKGAALALGKPCLMMVEEGIDEKEYGGLQGDDLRIHFTRNNFPSKVAEAIRMLNGSELLEGRLAGEPGAPLGPGLT